MDFIVDNYIWFIIGGVILIMTLIGYVADKTEFIKKQKIKDQQKKENHEKNKKEKKSKEQEVFEKEIDDEKNLVLEEGNISYPVEINDNGDLETDDEMLPDVDTSFEEQVEAENGLSFEEPLSLEEPVQTEKVNELEEIDSDIMKPLEGGILNLDNYDSSKDEGMIVEEIEPENIKSKEEANFHPSIEDENIELENAPVVEINNSIEEPASTEDLPNIETTDSVASVDIEKPKEESFNDTSDDNVWKF